MDAKAAKQAAVEGRLCPWECAHLSPTEDEQGIGKDKGHMCLLHKKRLIHGAHHPRLMAVDGCRLADKGGE